MNSLKKFTAAMAAIAVSMTSVFTFSVAVAATTFTDASGIASWASDSVTSLADAGVLSGRPDGSFDPQGQLNRAEVAKVAVLAAGLTEDATGAPHFNDVASSDWFYTYVETLYNNGVVGGINGGALDSNGLATYDPAGTLNRAEGSKILVDAFELETSYAGTPPNFPDVASSAWFYDYAETAYAHGILNGYDNGNFGPGDAITREQVAVIAQSSIEESADGSKRRSDYSAGAASSVESEEEEEPAVPTSEGDLNVALSASSPAAQTFPQGASSTAVAAYDFTATTDDVVITSLLVKRTGVGTDSDWTLYIYDGADRLTSGKTVNSTTHQAVFTGVNVTVAAGTTTTLTLKADTATSSTGGDSFFEISAADMISSNAQSVGGTFPVKSNKQEVNSSVSAGIITIIDTGSITNPKVGDDNVTIAKFKLTTENEAGLVSQISLLVDGKISATDVQNAKLYQGETELATVADVNSKDLLVFAFDTPYEIAKGDSRNFEVKADLNTGRATDTLQIYLDEGTDLVAIGGTYGFGMSVTYTGYDGTTGDISESTLQGGDVTISSSGPTAADVAVNAKDITLMDFNIVSVSEATFKKFVISLTTNDANNTGAIDEGGLLGGTAGTTSNYTDIKIINRDTGAVLMGPIDAISLKADPTDLTGTIAITDTASAGTDISGFYIFTDEFTMAAGEELNLALTCDIANNTGDDFVNDTVYGTLEIDTFYPEIKDLNNKTVTNTSSVVPTTDITGKTMSVQKASLTVTKSSTPVSDTAVKGTNDVSLIGLTMAAGAASDVKVTEMKVRLYANDNADFDTGGLATASGGAGGVSANDYISNVELWVGDTKIAGPKGMTLTGTITGTGYYYATFDSMNYTVDAGSTIQIVVKGDLSSNVSDTHYLAADIDPYDDITAEDVDGNTVDAAGTSNLNLATSPSPVVTISTGGSLTIAVDPDTAKEDIAVAGTSDVEISKFKFTTTDEAFIVKKLSINNRQSNVTNTTTLGNYDNNVVSVKLSYTNSGGTIETKTGYLTSGTANFSGLDMAIDKDDDAILTVSANLNTVAAGALSGEYVDLNIAFNDFEAVAQGSGETYTAAKLDATTTADSDLDIGSITWTDVGVNTNGSTTVGAAGASQTITISTTTKVFPVGTLLYVDIGTTGAYAEGTDPLFVTTATWSATTPTVTVLNDVASITTGLDVYYSLPGEYLTAANRAHIYESKPTITLSASSPSGSRTVAASDNAFIFTFSADAQEKVQFRAGVNLTDAVQGVGDLCTLDPAPIISDGNNVDGSAEVCEIAADPQTDDTIVYTASGTGVLSEYSRVNFWIKNTTAGTAVNFADLAIGVGLTSAATAPNHITALSQTDCYADAASMTTTEWYNCDLVMPDDTDANDIYFHLKAVDGTRLVVGDKIYTDAVRLYNDKVVVNIATDTDLDTYANNGTNAGAPVVAYLKEGGSTVATGYIGTTTAGAAATSSGKVHFIPTTAIEIAKGTSKTFTLNLNSGDLLHEDSGEDDPVTFSIDLGSSSDGIVTAGGIYWNETNFADVTNGGGGTAYSLTSSVDQTGVITWLGQVADSTLNGNTLKY